MTPAPTESLIVEGTHVRATQCLTVPLDPGAVAAVAERAARLRPEYLVDRYATSIRWWTHGIVRTVWWRGDLCLTLAARRGLRLLCLRPSGRHGDGTEAAGTAALRIVGGVAAAPLDPGGELVLRVAVRPPVAQGQATLRVDVLVDGYAPALLALPLPAPWRLAIYRATQARVHKAITFAFLRATVEHMLGSYQAGPPRATDVRTQNWR